MKGYNVARNIAIGAAMVLSLSFARAADDLPKADTILDKYVEVTGGKAAYEKHHNEVSSGTFEMAAMGLKGSMTSYREAPDKSYTETDLGSMGKVREGSDGKTYWSLNAMTGPHVKDGPEKAQAMLTSSFNAELNWRSLFKDAKTTGTETVDGKPCYDVLLTPMEGSAITQCYDKASYLMVKQSMTLQSPMGEQTVESFATDYRSEGGVLMPHKLRSTVANTEISISIDKVSFDTDIPADKFALPDEIKALVDKK